MQCTSTRSSRKALGPGNSNSGVITSVSRKNMTGSDEPDDRDTLRRERRQVRIDAVKRWAEYIRKTPVEEWGPQQNAVVDAQVEAARESGIDADDRKRVTEIAEELSDRSDDRE